MDTLESTDNELLVLQERYTSAELAQLLLNTKRTAQRAQTLMGLTYNDLPDNAVKSYRDNDSQVPTIDYDADLCYRAEGETGHRLFIGDNVDVLVGLSIAETGTYDMIYIDPPYNTGRTDFVYNDRFVNEEDPNFHTKWLSFMEPRLRLAQDLLKPTGVIFVAIGDSEHHRLRMLMDKVFGERNFISSIVWAGTIKNNSTFTSNIADYMLVYAKSKDSIEGKWREPKGSAPAIIEAGDNALREGYEKAREKFAGVSALDTGWPIEEVQAHFASQPDNFRKVAAQYATAEFRKWWKTFTVDEIEKGLKLYTYICDRTGRVHTSSDVTAPGDSGYRYDVLHPVTGLPVKVPSRGWPSSSSMDKLITDNSIIFGADHTTGVRFKRYLDVTPNQVPRSVFERDRSLARNHIVDIVGPNQFDFPKDHNELSRWIGMVAPKDGKILDFFAGSGSTAEAVLKLNAADGGTRTITLVTNDENNIGTNVTRERVVRVMSGKGWHNPKSAVSLGGQLAVYRVGSRPLGEHWNNTAIDSDRVAWYSWNRDAFLWEAVKTHLWLLEDEDGILTMTDDEGRELSGAYSFSAPIVDFKVQYGVKSPDGYVRVADAEHTVPYVQLQKVTRALTSLTRRGHVDYDVIAGLK